MNLVGVGAFYSMRVNSYTFAYVLKGTTVINSDSIGRYCMYKIYSPWRPGARDLCISGSNGIQYKYVGGNSCFERVEDFQYLGTTLTNQNSIQEEIKSRLKSGNACYHSVQKLMSSSLLSKNTQNYNFACCFVWV